MALEMTEPMSTPTDEPTPDTILTSDADAVRLVQLNRPDKLNAFDTPLYRALAGALTDARADDSVHAVVLTGVGRAFSAGQDLDEMARLASGESTDAGFPDLLEAVQSFDKPLLAAVNGVAIGIGFTMLAHCDIAIVADTARLRVPFAPLGVPPEAASSYLFPLRMGWQRAAQVLFTGDWVSGHQAVEWGLALECVMADSVVERTMELATQIASSPVGALRAIKTAMLDGQRGAIADARTREEQAFEMLLGSAATLGALDRFSADGTV